MVIYHTPLFCLNHALRYYDTMSTAIALILSVHIPGCPNRFFPHGPNNSPSRIREL